METRNIIDIQTGKTILTLSFPKGTPEHVWERAISSHICVKEEPPVEEVEVAQPWYKRIFG